MCTIFKSFTWHEIKGNVQMLRLTIFWKKPLSRRISILKISYFMAYRIIPPTKDAFLKHYQFSWKSRLIETNHPKNCFCFRREKKVLKTFRYSYRRNVSCERGRERERLNKKRLKADQLKSNMSMPTLNLNNLCWWNAEFGDRHASMCLPSVTLATIPLALSKVIRFIIRWKSCRLTVWIIDCMRFTCKHTGAVDNLVIPCIWWFRELGGGRVTGTERACTFCFPDFKSNVYLFANRLWLEAV